MGKPKKHKEYEEEYPKDMLSDLFGGEDLPIDGQAEDFYVLDMDEIGRDANIMATSMISSVLRLYNNKDFVEEHPDFKKRIDTEIESLKKLYKMAQTNEIVHDHLAQAISKNSSNASLYMALDKVQARIMTVDHSIREILDGLNKICNNYQMELNFEAVKKGDDPDEDGMAVRGGKAFIDMMNMPDDDETDESDLFEEEIEDNE